MTGVEVVGGIYEAFGRGDAVAALDAMQDVLGRPERFVDTRAASRALGVLG